MTDDHPKVLEQLLALRQAQRMATDPWLAALRKIRDTLRRPDLGPGTTLRIVGEIVDQALPKEPTT